MKSIFLGVVLVLTPYALFANSLTVTINGMVCAFCAQGIKKKFESESAVKDVDVDLDHKIVKIDLKKNESLDPERIKKIVVDAGYELEGIQTSESPQKRNGETN